MQRIRIDRRKLITFIVCISACLIFILLDQLSKAYFVKLNDEINLRVNYKKVLGDFFYFTFVYNPGSAYGMFANKPWAQTLFLILTPITLVFFILALIYAIKNKYFFLMVALTLIISGAIGNYIDRITLGKVVDFLCVEIADNRIFGVFNVADTYLSIGMVMVIIHLLFIDKNAVFGKSNGKQKN